MQSHPTNPVTLAASVDRYARLTPDALACTDGHSRLTWQQLQLRSQQLARLLQQHGCQPGEHVVIYMSRTPEILAAIVAVWNCAGSYTIVEKNQCDSFADRDAALILTDEPALSADDGTRVVSVTAAQTVSDAEASSRIDPAATAYILYTSGSTGKPKGVMVSHQNILHYTSQLADYLQINRPLCYAHVSTLAADLGNTSLFLALYTGGTLALMPDEARRDPAQFAEFLTHCQVDFLKITPSHWQVMNPSAARQEAHPLQYLLLGGERLDVALAGSLLASGRIRHLVNHYGPTETTVGVLARIIEAEDLTQGESAPVGLPFGQTRALVMENGREVTGEGYGELWIGGPSVTAGYAGQPQQTAERFVSLPGYPGRLYKTGDRVYRDVRGLIYFCGRTDRQVKINGYRVELDHIEHCVNQLAGIRSCAVELIQWASGQAAGVAIEPDGSLSEEQVREQLNQLKLPQHMKPGNPLFYTRLPLNINGKIDRKQIKTDLQQFMLQRREKAPMESDDPLLNDILRCWNKHLHFADFGLDDPLYSVGGNSIIAIQIISELQILGYSVLTQRFMETPTVNGLYRLLSAADNQDTTSQTAGIGVRRLSAAQRTFMQLNFTDADHWSQAMLFTCGHPLQPQALQRALGSVIAHHPILTTRFSRDAAGMPCADGGSAQSAPVLRVEQADATDLQAQIWSLNHHLQSQLSLADGRLMQCGLLQNGDQSQLLFIIHHLAVDAVSWRILLRDVVRFYESACVQQAPEPGRVGEGFWQWTEHLHQHREQLQAQRNFWSRLPRLAHSTDFGEERHSENGFLTLSREEVAQIDAQWVKPHGTTLDMLLLAAFSRAALQTLEKTVAIDVESYGRAVLDNSADIARAVGWFTSTFPFVPPAEVNLQQMLTVVDRQVKSVPNLGIAWQYFADEDTARSPFSFNFLGEFELEASAGLDWTHSCWHPGAVRGNNARQYALTLTVKQRDGRLVLDCNYASTHYSRALIASLLHSVRNQLMNTPPVTAEQQTVEFYRGSSAGLLNWLPADTQAAPAAAVTQKKPAAVLVTGATGYIGGHVLKGLLEQTQANIYCLVRAASPQDARQRLEKNFSCYFSTHEWQGWQARITPLAGDITRPELGLDNAQYQQLSRELDAIYHFAADTRLFDGKSDIILTNLDALDNILQLAQQCPRAELHYMSTLAVAGWHPAGPVRRFSERDLDLHQEFNNNYELSKFKAENKVMQYRNSGRRAFIYRTGNVTGHSRNGRFQRNQQENRLVQTLMALARAGQAPEASTETVVLSPVDIVAQGVVQLSLDDSLSGGVFHVESNHEVSMQHIFNALLRYGLVDRLVRQPTVKAVLYSADCDDDQMIALGRFWSARPPRNVFYDNTLTTERLARVGVAFTPLSREWINTFISGLSCLQDAAQQRPAPVLTSLEKNTL